VEGSDGKADSVSYTYSSATLPDTLATVFKIDTVGGVNYVSKKDGVSDEAIITAVTEYLKTVDESTAVKSEKATTDQVAFTGLDFGYYGIKSSKGAAVAIDSANPNAIVFEKNSTTEVHKTVDHQDYSIGDTIKYTSTFSTSNYLMKDGKPYQVTKIKVTDTLPPFLSNVQITSVKVLTADRKTEQDDLTAHFSGTGFNMTTDNTNTPIYGTRFVQWATYDKDTKTWTSKYANNSILEVKYEGTLTDVTNIDAYARVSFTATWCQDFRWTGCYSRQHHRSPAW
jgi:hypothetical protein